jgi:phosphatidylinositol alpha-1,6-mannosyltransferase
MRTLLVTNDFPPRAGGIQAYLHALATRLPDDQLVVYASTSEGSQAFDAAQPFPVLRDRATVLLPTPRVRKAVARVMVGEGCDRIWYGAAAPLGLLGRFDAERVIACTQGHEVGWARLPVARQLFQRIAREADALTHLSHYTRDRLQGAVPGDKLVHLPSGVDATVFRPGAGGADVRRRHGLGDRPVVVCVSRLVPRKGQQRLVQALALVRRRVPDAALLLVGDGPDLGRIRSLAADLGLAKDVVVTGAVPWEELPAHYDAGDVFAMPCTDRWGGLEVEGLGLVFLEAAATGLPVVVGRSGGASDTVQDGVTGYLVDGSSIQAIADRLAPLLADPTAASAMGAAGRAWMESEWQWEGLASKLDGLLRG